MGRIEILYDSGHVYGRGEIIEIKTLIRDYCECDRDPATEEWLYRIPIPDAVKFIADMWGIDYRFI